MISNDNSNTNRWEAYGKTDLDKMFQNSLSNLNLTEPPPTLNPRHQTHVPAHQPANTSTGPTAVPPGAPYRYPQPQQGFYLQLPTWVQGKGSIPPLYQQVASLCADPRQSYYMLTDRIQPLLISSGLDQEKLKAIWNVSCRTVAGVLTLTECYTALGLVALAQQGHEINMDKLASLSFIPIPRIDTTRVTLYQAPAPPPVLSAPPVAVANRPAPIEPHGFGAFHNAKSSASSLNPPRQGTALKQEFGNFQSASPVEQVPLSLHSYSNNTEEFGQLHSASPIQPGNTESIASLVPDSVVTDPSDKYSCFRDIEHLEPVSADIGNQDTAPASVPGANDKYAFLRALDVTNEQKETPPPVSLNSTFLQSALATNDQDLSTLKSADSTPLQPAATINNLDISLCDTTRSTTAPTNNSTSLVPNKTSEFSDFSDFSMFVTATSEQSTSPSEVTATDWSAFASNAGTADSTALPAADKYSVFSQEQGDPTAPLSNLLSSLGQAETSLSQSAVSEQLCVLTPRESSVSVTGVGDIQAKTEIDWGAFNSTTTTTTIGDKYSVFSQLQSAADIPPSSSPELPSTQKPLDSPLANNTSLTPSLDAYSLITENEQYTVPVAQAPLTPPPLPTERDKQDLSQFPARHLTGIDSLKEFNYNEPPPLDDVPNDNDNDNDTHGEDFGYSGFDSFPEIRELKSKKQETSNNEGNKLVTNLNLQNKPSVLLEKGSSSDAIDLDTQHNEVTPLAPSCPPLSSLSLPFAPSVPNPPTDALQLSCTENDLNTDLEEKTPLANTAQLLSQVQGGNQLENKFSFFSHFQMDPGDDESRMESNNLADVNAELKGSSDLSLPYEQFVPSQNLDFSEFSSFPKTSDCVKPESPPEDNCEGNEKILQCDSDPFQDLSSLSSLNTNDLMKGRASKPQEPKWTLFDTLATALQDINSVPIDSYKNQMFQPKKEPITGIQREETFARRSPLPPEARQQDFGEFIGASNAPIAHKQLSRAPSYILGEDSRREVKEACSQTLSACARVIQVCYDKVKRATSVQILRELCQHDSSRQYFEAVFEVMKIVYRIKKQLPPGWEQPNAAYENITENWANIKAYLNHGGLEFSDVIVSAGADAEGSGYCCGVCLDGITRGDIRIALGGFNYHSTCANFWLNEVGSMLPRLSRESHGTSL